MSELNGTDFEVGQRVRSAREDLGFEQSYVADQIGMPLAEFCKCEAGLGRFGAENLIKISRLLNLPPSRFSPKFFPDDSYLH